MRFMWPSVASLWKCVPIALGVVGCVGCAATPSESEAPEASPDTGYDAAPADTNDAGYEAAPSATSNAPGGVPPDDAVAPSDEGISADVAPSATSEETFVPAP